MPLTITAPATPAATAEVAEILAHARQTPYQRPPYPSPNQHCLVSLAPMFFVRAPLTFLLIFCESLTDGSKFYMMK